MAPQFTFNHLFILAGTAAASLSIQYTDSAAVPAIPSQTYELTTADLAQIATVDLFRIGSTTSSLYYSGDTPSIPQYTTRHRAKVRILPPRALTLPSFGEGEE